MNKKKYYKNLIPIIGANSFCNGNTAILTARKIVIDAFSSTSVIYLNLKNKPQRCDNFFPYFD